MWARIAEVALALFLAISTFLIPGAHKLWIFNCLIALWILIFSFLSYYPRLQKIHLMNLVAIAVLIIFVFIQPNPPPPPPFQNYMAIALLLCLFSIIPSHASRPPDKWINFHQKNDEDNG